MTTLQVAATPDPCAVIVRYLIAFDHFFHLYGL